MRQRRRDNRAKNYCAAAALTAASVICFLLIFGASVRAQAKDSNQAGSVPQVTMCELLQNSRKYNNKRVQVSFFLQVSAEAWNIKHEEGCPVVEGITVGTADTFESANDPITKAMFEKATDLRAAGREGSKKMPTYNFQWGSLLRVQLNARGIFRASKKPKYGHLEAYKNLFLITEIEEIGQAQLLHISDVFKKDPTPILIVDYN